MKAISQYEILDIKEEPIVTFNEILNKLKVLDIEENDEIGLYLRECEKQAINYIENYCFINIFRKNILIKFSDLGCPECNSKGINHYLETVPVNFINEIIINTSEGERKLDNKDYTLLKNSKTFSYLNFNKNFSLKKDDLFPIKINIDSGWGEKTPGDLKRAILEIISILYNNLSDSRKVDLNVDTFIGSNVKFMLNNYRILYV